MTTRTFEPDATRSIAPPIPLTIFPGITQFAISPYLFTYIAPRTVKSKCPPLTMANESLLLKVEDPIFNVIDSFPAFTRSPNSCPGFG